jgi:hypothetical protein
MNRKIGFVLADTHAGNDLGLLSPNTQVDIELPDGRVAKKTLELNPVQWYLNQVFEWLLEVATKFAAGDEILFIHNGDLTQGNNHGSLISPSETVQETIALKNMSRVLDALPTCRTIRILKGTGVHVFQNGDSESMVGKLLGLQYPDRDVRVLYHDLINFYGVSCDFSHHGPPPGRRTWLEGNEARYYLRSLMLAELVENRLPARLVVRAHYHSYVKEAISMMVNGSEVQSTIVVCPSLCMTDDYARKVVKSPHRISLGGLFFEIIDGRLTDVHVAVKTTDIRTKEVIDGTEGNGPDRGIPAKAGGV